jgi:hypothetical protein
MNKVKDSLFFLSGKHRDKSKPAGLLLSDREMKREFRAFRTSMLSRPEEITNPKYLCL